MRRGTTPTIRFDLPMEMEMVENVWLTISQRGSEVLTKTLDEMQVDGSTVAVKLSQLETLSLRAGQVIQIQVRIKCVSGDAIASEIKCMEVEAILKDGVI